MDWDTESDNLAVTYLKNSHTRFINIHIDLIGLISLEVQLLILRYCLKTIPYQLFCEYIALESIPVWSEILKLTTSNAVYSTESINMLNERFTASLFYFILPCRIKESFYLDEPCYPSNGNSDSNYFHCDGSMARLQSKPLF